MRLRIEFYVVMMLIGWNQMLEFVECRPDAAHVNCNLTKAKNSSQSLLDPDVTVMGTTPIELFGSDEDATEIVRYAHALDGVVFVLQNFTALPNQGFIIHTTAGNFSAVTPNSGVEPADGACEDGQDILYALKPLNSVLLSLAEDMDANVTIFAGSGFNLPFYYQRIYISSFETNATFAPTSAPQVNYFPTAVPTSIDDNETFVPSAIPTILPTMVPSTNDTDANETFAPSAIPTIAPTMIPSTNDTEDNETFVPTAAPTFFGNGTEAPTAAPTVACNLTTEFADGIFELAEATSECTEGQYCPPLSMMITVMRTSVINGYFDFDISHWCSAGDFLYARRDDESLTLEEVIQQECIDGDSWGFVMQGYQCKQMLWEVTLNDFLKSFSFPCQMEAKYCLSQVSALRWVLLDSDGSVCNQETAAAASTTTQFILDN